MKCKICGIEFANGIQVVNDDPAYVKDEQGNIIDRIDSYDSYCFGCYELRVEKHLTDA